MKIGFNAIQNTKSIQYKKVPYNKNLNTGADSLSFSSAPQNNISFSGKKGKLATAIVVLSACATLLAGCNGSTKPTNRLLSEGYVPPSHTEVREEKENKEQQETQSRGIEFQTPGIAPHMTPPKNSASSETESAQEMDTPPLSPEQRQAMAEAKEAREAAEAQKKSEIDSLYFLLDSARHMIMDKQVEISNLEEEIETKKASVEDLEAKMSTYHRKSPDDKPAGWQALSDKKTKLEKEIVELEKKLEQAKNSEDFHQEEFDRIAAELEELLGHPYEPKN